MTITITIPDEELKGILLPLIGGTRERPGETKPESVESTFVLVQKTGRIMLSNEGLSVRARNILEGADINTLEDLLRCSERFLWSLRNMGRKTIDEIRSYLENKGYAIGMLPAVWKVENRWNTYYVHRTDVPNEYASYDTIEEAERVANRLNKQ